LKERQKEWEDEEEYVSMYWITLRKIEPNGTRARKH
jgi:hypothetical protein